MKKKALVFIFVVLIALSIVPVINLFRWGILQHKAEEKWWSHSVLYSLDFVLPY